MVQFVRQLAPAEKLELYKKIKGYYLFETGIFNINDFRPILDEKARDVIDVVDYEMPFSPMEIYKDYVNGRY